MASGVVAPAMGGRVDWTPGTYIFQNKDNDTTYVAQYNASYLALKVRHCTCRTRTPEQSAYRLQFLDALFTPVGTAPNGAPAMVVMVDWLPGTIYFKTRTLIIQANE